MTLAFLIYAMSFLGKLTAAIGVASGILSLTLLAVTAALVIEPDIRKSNTIKWYKRGIITLITISVLNVFIPSEKTGWMMVGGYAAQTAYQSEAGEKLKKIVTNKLDVILEEQLSDAQKLVDKKKPKE